MKETNDYELKKALSQLPAYKTAVSWEDFKDFEANKQLKTALAQLPEYATDLTWEALAAPKNKANVVAFRRLIGVAASLLVMVSTWLFLKNDSAEINHTVEVVQQFDFQSGNNEMFRQLMENLPETNRKSVAVRQIRVEYEQLANDQKLLENALSMYESDADLLQEWVKIENEKAILLNELAQFI